MILISLTYSIYRPSSQWPFYQLEVLKPGDTFNEQTLLGIEGGAAVSGLEPATQGAGFGSEALGGRSTGARLHISHFFFDLGLKPSALCARADEFHFFRIRVLAQCVENT